MINGEEIVTTETHPFYVNDRGFVNAGELIVGDELLDVNGNVLLVEKFNVELTDKPVKGYNKNVTVKYTKNKDGNLYPSFEKFAHPEHPNPIKMKAKLTGVFRKDVKIIRNETGIKLPKDYTWHHL